jgi:CRP-like cAMP-binding protein
MTSPPPPTTQPWDRQPRETEPAYEAFLAYRDLGSGRSLAKVGAGLGKSEALMERWSSRWGWVERARAYDVEVQRRSDEDFFSEARKHARSKRHAQIAELNAEALALPARELLRRLQSEPALLSKLSISQLVVATGVAARALNRTVVTERLALGLSTENLGDHEGGAFGEAIRRASTMTDDELDQVLDDAGVVRLDDHRPDASG